MTKFTINIDTFGFTRAGHTFTVDPSKLNADIVAQLVMHGATQKIGDAAAGKQGDDALKAMQGVYDTLVAGDWGRSRGGAGEEPVMRYIRAIVRTLLSDAKVKEYKALEPDAKNDWLNAVFDAQTDENKTAIRVAAEEEMAEDMRKKAAAKKRASGLGIAI